MRGHERRELTSANALVFVLVFFGYNTMVTSQFFGARGSLVIVAGAVVLNLLFVVSRRLDVAVPSLLVFLLLSVNVLSTMLYTGDGSHGNYLLMIKMLLALVVVSAIPFRVFRSSFVNVMTFLAAYSLLSTYVLARTPLRGLALTFTNSAGIRFLNFGFANVLDFPGYYRNFGIFTEPGIYVCYLIPALVFAISEASSTGRREVYLLKIPTLALTLISTLSPVGVFSAFALVFVAVALNFHISLRTRLLLLVWFAVILALITQVPNSSGALVDSTSKLTEQQSSYVGRTYVLAHNMDIWLSSPFLGKGLTNVIQVIGVGELQAIANSNTSTTTLYMAVYGLGFGLASLIPLYFALRSASAVVSLVGFGAFVWSINSEALFHSEFLWYLIFYGVSLACAAATRGHPTGSAPANAAARMHVKVS